MNRYVLCSLLFIIWLTGCRSESGSLALGMLERDRITLKATAAEIIRSLPVKEGQTVKKGQVLVRLDTRNQLAVLDQAKAEQARATAYLQKLTNGERPEDVAAAQAKVFQTRAIYLEAEKNYQRKKELVRKKLISQSEKDAAQATKDSAQASLRSARESFAKLTAGARIEDIEQAKASLAATKAEVTLQTQKLQELTIVATRDGIIDSLPHYLGERVSVNSTLAVIQANRIPYARIYVPARHRIQFVPGKRVDVHVDGSSVVYQGTVRWVAHEASFTPYFALTEDERARLMYLAKVDLDESAADLPSGLPVQVDLTGKERE
ncbi:putative efflux pump membrane fusion protein [Vibrio aerogenes CECT 7868]|uniref:Putative efflux pump membrane fusion protein n=1 Tax=Vibrio aerogenes CECT 7868 TaxID=1216006 RepID=A0A1M6CYP1_9VIBR|nr:HlyD family efflux transporter periplasmic adaptor subunit [Vibrio aerogenes]SHI66117.1 putative efflux pump membrane fusion protein [Vibrio aerogenes CECT 7868]